MDEITLYHIRLYITLIVLFIAIRRIDVVAREALSIM